VDEHAISGRFPNAFGKIFILNTQKTRGSFGRAEICIEATVGVLMTALDSHDLLPIRVSDTLPGLRFSRLAISECERTGSAAFIALI
jgi:hypothetical protein